MAVLLSRHHANGNRCMGHEVPKWICTLERIAKWTFVHNSTGLALPSEWQGMRDAGAGAVSHWTACSCITLPWILD